MKNITTKIQFCLFILLALFLGKSNLFAQQEAIYSQYMFNRMVINPAYAGVKGCLDLTAQYRHQWTSFPNAPRNFLASGHIGIDKYKSGIGGFVSVEGIGAFSNLALGVNYAFHIPLNDYSKLSLGLQGALLQYSINEDKVNLANKSDETFLATTSQSVIKPDVGFGVFYHTSRFYVGASVLHLVPVKFPVYQNANDSYIRQHFFFNVGGDMRLSNEFKLSPSVFARLMPNAPIQVDLNANLMYRKVFWFGLGYRLNDAAIANIGFFIKEKIRIGYSFDFTTSYLKMNNTLGTHELMLNYTICKTKSKAKSRQVTTPEYF